MVSDKETNLYKLVHLSPNRVGKSENQQTSITAIHNRPKSVIEKKVTRTEDKTMGCCCLTKSKSKIHHNTTNHANILPTSTKYRKFEMNISSKLNDETTINIPMLNNTHIKNILTASSQNIQTPMKSIEHIEMKDPTSNKTEINIHDQSVILNSLIIDHNCHNTESSIDLQNIFMESNENKSLLPLHSRYLVSFEFANREEHLVEVAELKRSFYRVSRMDTYKKVRERLTIMNLIDIDLTTLLRAILQSFP
ncbi:unnamed protein product [Rotaria sordida]|uniref:Uncharacterized protein n=1 Tax=Rotaria sordida TaxID=392033 RepID=A0A813WKK3_9BILA|nr:unnamed protein product [Rotaria sordida]